MSSVDSNEWTLSAMSNWGAGRYANGERIRGRRRARVGDRTGLVVENVSKGYSKRTLPNLGWWLFFFFSQTQHQSGLSCRAARLIACDRALKGRNLQYCDLQFTKRDIYKKLIEHLYSTDREINSLREELETERASNAQRRASRCYTPGSSVASSASSSPRTKRYPHKQVKRNDS